MDIIDGKFKDGNGYRIIKEEDGSIRLILVDEDRQKIKTKHEDYTRYINIESFIN